MNKFWQSKLAIAMACAFFGTVLAQGSVSEASTLYPGMGKKPASSWHKADTPSKSEATATKKTSRWKGNNAGSTQNTGNTAGKSTAGKTSGSWQQQNEGASLIRVGLAESVASARITSRFDYNIYNSANTQVLGEFHSSIVANLTVDKGTIAINGQNTGCTEVIISSVATSEGEQVNYNNTNYRGKIVVTCYSNALTVVNYVNLDDYVKGVLPAEMSPSWPGEALKAQAVAARTFALYTKANGQHRGRGYDVCDSTHCQSYGGLGAESSTSNQAATATSGEIMQYNGRAIYAPFHASSGGATENSEDVWGTYLPYLRSVKDDDSKSPYHNWSVRFTVAQVEKLLNAASKGVGTLKSISMEPIASSQSVTARTPSGRVYGVKFVGTTGTTILTGEKARQIFGLKSAMISVRTEKKLVLPTSNKPASDKGNTKSNTASKNKGKLDKQPVAMTGNDMRVSGIEAVIFDGHGFGHGLGMSQYGAKAMAEAGNSYDAILLHYYTGVDLRKIY